MHELKEPDKVELQYCRRFALFIRRGTAFSNLLSIATKSLLLGFFEGECKQKQPAHVRRSETKH